jgi:hypothetical protein
MQFYRMCVGGRSFHIDLAQLMRVKRMRQESWTQEVNREKVLLTTMTCLTLECQVQL